MGSRIAIIGMDASIGNADGIDLFDRRLYRGEVGTASTLFGAAEALNIVLSRSAAAVKMNEDGIDLVVISASGVDAAAFKNRFRSLHVSQDFADALDRAQLLLNDKQRLVAIAAVTGNTADSKSGVHSLALEAEMQSYMRAGGAGVVLLKRAETAVADDFKVYAFIEGYSSDEQNRKACIEALVASGVSASEVELVEATVADDEAAQLAEWSILNTIYKPGSEKNHGELTCAFGSARSVTGECGAFSALAGLIKTTLCLYQRYIPAVNAWKQPKATLQFDASPFYFPTESRPWYQGPHRQKRIAAVNIQESTRSTHLILAENELDLARSNGYISNLDCCFLPVSAVSADQLIERLTELAIQVEQSNDLKQLARAIYQRYIAQRQKYVAVILGDSVAELRKEIEMLKSGIDKAATDKDECKTPKGSYVTFEPVGAEKGVTFMYPGVGAAYVGLGRDIFHLFPQIVNDCSAMARDIGATLQDHLLNPRSRVALGFKDNKAIDLQLRRSLASISECGVGFACVVTKIFKDVFKIEADYALGYSMGEVSMFAALDCWEDPGAFSERMAQFPTFNHDLTGELQTLRKHWGLPPAQPGVYEKLWETYTIKGTVEEVAAACEDEDRVYVTIVNTPESVVIGGYPEACERVIANLGVRAMAMEISNAIHSEPAFKEYEAMERLYTLETKGRVDTKIYSSSCYLPVPHRSKSIANSIAKCFCEQVDFPRLINTVYDKGARVYMEMGPGRSLCSWIDKILKHEGVRPHVSIPVNAKGTPDEVTLFRALAKLVSHGVPVNLEVLYSGSVIEAKQ
jgi:PfaB family protein